VTAGLIGFLVILALVVAAVLLFRSMTRHMRRVPDRFGETEPGDDAQSSGRG
jgi:O-antigen ligase